MNPNQMICELRTYSNQPNTHKHGYSQLILPLNGSLAIETKAHQVTLDEDYLFFLPASVEHNFHAEATNSFLVVDMPKNYSPHMASFDSNCDIYQKIDDKWQAIRFLLRNEIDQMNKSKKGHGDMSHVQGLLDYAMQSLNKTALPKSIQYINDNIGDKISLEDLAALENFNTTYYIEWFKKIYGKSPYAYIKALRIEKSKNLLLESSRSIMEIAFMLGYENQSSFTRAFKKDVGMTPKSFRKQLK